MLLEFSNVCNDNETIVVGRFKTVILSVYRPPSGNIQEFLNFINTFFEYALQFKIRIILVGGLNTDMSASTLQLQNFQDSIESFFLPLFVSPTRIILESATVIDLCVTNFEPSTDHAGISSVAISDHLPFFCFFQDVRNKKKIVRDNPVFSRKFIRSALYALHVMLKDTHWNDVYNASNPDPSYDLLISKVKQCYDNYSHCNQLKNTGSAENHGYRVNCAKIIKARD